MRERFALLVCWLTLVMVVGLSWRFAVRHNPALPPAPPVAPVSVPALPPGPGAANETGARLFREQGCASCHALGGAGNPRYPLDGVGARRSRDELRVWTTGTGLAAERLSPMVVRRKQRYQELSDADMAALVEYLSAARSP
jgi:mono/diheme cytochrome c family protein